MPYRQDVLKIRKRTVAIIGSLEREYTRIVPRNGIRLNHGEQIAVIISGTVLSRDMAEVLHGGPNKTYTFPSTVIAIRQAAFQNSSLEHADLRAARDLKILGRAAFSQCEKLRRVQLNEGLEVISDRCFA